MELCPALGISIPVGKDSLSMATEWSDGDQSKKVIAPVSLIISAFASVMDVRKTSTPLLQLKNQDGSALETGGEFQGLGFLPCNEVGYFEGGFL